ncbi:GreA/GreB family elongation factor [Horticoccus sp. 23ND18S-11]|uniref:GreA/GreB family elongation factor n=1 Tax=Horticoccus sp. 23ND18S-11 TaxID=3391832 RepID=UPI0039C8FD21
MSRAFVRESDFPSLPDLPPVVSALPPGARNYIVGVDEIDLDRNWVSWLSPLARALQNARRGETVTLKTPRGTRELQIVDIVCEP